MKICQKCGNTYKPYRLSSKFCSMKCLASSKRKDITGKRFGKLTAIKSVGFRKRLVTLFENIWECQCDCGRRVEVFIGYLPEKKSCGCLVQKRGGFLNNKHNIRFFGVWKSMLRRCTNKDDESFSRYGGKGITVCESWKDFENFKKDMFPSYKKGLTLDRINGKKGYSPENCRWATRLVQAQNRDGFCRPLTYNGKTMTVAEWARELGFTESILYGRLNKGWDTEKTLSTIVKKKL